MHGMRISVIVTMRCELVLMTLAEENDAISKEGARNGEWVKIFLRKFWAKDLVFVKSSADDTKVSIPGVERPWLSETAGFIMPNHDTGRILLVESQRNTTDPSVALTDSSVTDYDSADESSVCSTPLPLLKKLDGAEPISGPKTIKSILRSKSTFKAETLKGVIINKPSSAPVKGNKSSSASKVNSAPPGKLKSVKIKDDHPLDIYERTDHRTYDHAEYISTMNMSRHLKSLGRSSSRSKIPRPSKRFFPPCIHCGCIDHLSNECLYYLIDHDTNGHNRIISLEREINPRYHQHAFKICEACSSLTHTTTNHYDIEWFKRGEALQAKKAEALKSTMVESSNANRSQDLPLYRKHHRASFKTKPTSSIKKCLHLLHMDLFGPVTPRSINHEKYTLVIVDEYSRSSILVIVCDEKGISQNFSSPYILEQNGVAERKNRTLIEAARTMLSGSIFLKQYWTEAVATACYTQNRFTILLRQMILLDKTHWKCQIIVNPRAGMLTRAMAKELSAASAHECLFVDFLSEEDPKKVSKALRHPRWVDAMQDELNQFSRNKVWTLVLAPYGKTIIGSK
ncbi:retrovirus-related pol polyprotein from transposon TNT 1-94 [Tanacetum coccineum]